MISFLLQYNVPYTLLVTLYAYKMLDFVFCNKRT